MASKNIYQILIEEHIASFKTNAVTCSLADYLEAETKLIRGIERVLKSKQECLVALNLDYKKAAKAIETDISDLRKTCKHRMKKYHGDASGNNDSWYECEHCGAPV